MGVVFNSLGPCLSRLRAAMLGGAAALFATTTGSGQITVTNATNACGLNVAHQPSLACFGNAQTYMTGGMAVGDFNNDGWPDVFTLGSGMTADKLMINNGDGTFTNQAAAWGVAATHGGFGAAVGDYNNDGWQDIFVTSYGNPAIMGQTGKHRLYRNNGDGTFTDFALQAGVTTTSTCFPSGHSAAWGDYNLDGHLDLFVAGWKDCLTQQQPPCNTCNGGNNGAGNRLFRNNGDGTFSDVTSSAIGAGLTGAWGFTPAFIDMDGDLYPEILLAADFHTSRYLVNNKNGTFTNSTAMAGTGQDAFGMGQAVADYDNDGYLDWYVTSIYQDVCIPPATQCPHPYLNGNVLYWGNGHNQFVAAPESTGVSDGGWGWGVLALDLDHDTKIDLIEVNGRPSSNEWQNERGYLYRNNGDRTFTEIGIPAGFDHIGEGRAIAWLDADRDGDQDFVVMVNAAGLLYYRNDTPNQGNWLRVAFDTSNNPRLAANGIGTRVTATVGSQSYVQYFSAGPSYLATSELALHFGLGEATTVDTLTIRWAKGYVTVLNNVKVNQVLTIQSPRLGDINGDMIVNVDDLLLLLSGWGPCPVGNPCPQDVTGTGVANVDDLLVLLSNWG